MLIENNWQDELYNNALDEELRGLERRLASTACATAAAAAYADAAASLEGTLAQLYELEGSDWLGRGEAGAVRLSAQIAAYEIVIARLRREANAD